MPNRKNQLWARVKPFIALGLLTTVIFTLLIYGTAYYLSNQQIEVLKTQEHAKIQLTKWLLMESFEHAATDLQSLAELPATLSFNRNRIPENKHKVEDILSVQLERKPTYYQLRFVDDDGSELVRVDYVNGRSLRTPDHQLQSKASRYYFKNIQMRSVGEVYVSPLDLNIENDQIDAPYLPTVRFGTPVFDPRTGKRGVMVLNVSGESMLETFRLAMMDSYDTFLLNSEGHILQGPNTNQQWGFMFGLPSFFKIEHPDAWDTIRASDSGEVRTRDGLFLFGTVYPLKRIGALPSVNAGEDTAENYYWKNIIFIPESALPKIGPQRQPWLAIGYLSGLIILLFLVFYIYFSHHKRSQLMREVAEHAKRFGAISNVLAEGLIVMNKAGVVTYANREAEQILGWSAADLVSQKGHHVFHVHGEDEANCPILNAMKAEEIYRSQKNTFRRKDGTQISVSLNAAPLGESSDTEGIVVSFQDITKLKNYQDKIELLAFQDSLTGLPNRRVLEERLAHAAGMSERHNHYLALMFLDLDHFKEVNDRYGHDAGDILLKEVALRLTKCVRTTDTVIRMGGDEFIILLSEISNPDNASKVAAKIIQSVGEPIQLQDGEARVGVSIGIAVAQGKNFAKEKLMHEADAAMYDAKRAGKNRFVVREHKEDR